MVTPEFWHSRRVLLTGHTGFKGGWLSLWLRTMGAQITGYSLAPPLGPSLYAAALVESGVNSIFGDVRDLHALTSVVEHCRPEIVIHMAAQAIVRRSLREPVDTFATNVMGTVHVLAASRNCSSTRVVLIVTSDKCYEASSDPRGICEEDPLGGRDPYSASKACAELAAAAYRNSFGGCPGAPLIATVRAGNVLGGGDWAEDRLVPDLIRAFQRGETARIRYPNAVRPWQHVLDPLCGYLLLAEQLYRCGDAFAGAWNFAPPATQACSVRTVADVLAQAWGDGAHWTSDNDVHPHETQVLRLNSTKAESRLGWCSRLSVEETLESVAQWHRASAAGEDMRRITESQIDRYCSRVHA